MRMLIQQLTLCLHIFSLAVGLYILWKIKLYRPLGTALVLDSLTGVVYYSAILFFNAPGHELSIVRSIIHATVWAFFGTGIIFYHLVKQNDHH